MQVMGTSTLCGLNQHEAVLPLLPGPWRGSSRGDLNLGLRAHPGQPTCQGKGFQGEEIRLAELSTSLGPAEGLSLFHKYTGPLLAQGWGQGAHVCGLAQVRGCFLELTQPGTAAASAPLGALQEAPPPRPPPPAPSLPIQMRLRDPQFSHL